MADGDGIDLPGNLDRDVGPLPLYVWLGAGVAGLGLAWYWNKRRKAGGADSADDTTDPAAVDGGAAAAAATPFLPTSFVVGGGGGTGGNATGSSATPTGDSPVPDSSAPAGYTSNGAWRNAAIGALGKLGFSTVLVDDALARYLESQPLTANQAQVVQTALQVVGPAPDPVPAAPTPPPEPGQPTSQPTAPAAPAAPAAWVKPSWIGTAKFVKGDGPAVYLVTPQGLEWIPSESAFYALGGGGTITLADGQTHTFAKKDGTPPIVVSDAALAALPKVGTLPP